MLSGYLDPASGSAIISGVVAGAAGAVVTAKTMMTKMRLRKRDDAPDPADAPTTSDIVDESLQ
ncbi:MAG: hypothetical protein R8F63_12780 [Acidimicrobiales bacterium]|nr:hypothetical protein [Acidimicrobiales bacterium]